MAEFYKHKQSELVTVFVPPDKSDRQYRVTGLEPNSGVYFVGYVEEANYTVEGLVADHMNRIGHYVYRMSIQPGVTEMAYTETQDTQLQIRRWFDVEITSTSGNSTTTIRAHAPLWTWTDADFTPFKERVAKVVSELDAAEAS